jgi:hypothetical protein
MKNTTKVQTKTSQITVRGVDPVLKATIVRNARLKGVSINEWALDAIRATAGLRGLNIAVEPSWKKFVGCVPQDAFSQDVLDDFEKIDESMWAK